MDMDWAAIMDSEIIQNYLQNRLQKEASEAKKPQVDSKEVIANFYEFEKAVKASPELSLVFREMQKKLATDAEYRANVDEAFVNGVMLLNLDEQE